ncbi:MAG: hypothetical protein DME38_07500 [Verrucomicrobia bacterium]|nr:MAG: hypothetical protein DME38_07500 [Verrucomicrobiota bacterium]
MLHQEISSHKEDKVHSRKRLQCSAVNWRGEPCEPAGVAELRASSNVSRKKTGGERNSPPGLKFGLWLQKVFGAVKRTNALVLLFLR